jgi:hypothetical protein
MWLSLETQFLGNAQTRALQLDTELRMLEQGNVRERLLPEDEEHG